MQATIPAVGDAAILGAGAFRMGACVKLALILGYSVVSFIVFTGVNYRSTKD
jgi:hypothetical protein